MKKAPIGLQEEWKTNLGLSPGHPQFGDIKTTLAEVEIFNSLTEDELFQLEQIVHLRVYRPQEIIVRQGDPGVGMFIIHSGTADIMLTVPSATVKVRKEGNTFAEIENEGLIQLARLSEFQFFGEMSLLDGDRRAATVIAIEPTYVVGFFRADLIELISRSPKLGFKIIFRLSQLMNLRLQESLKEFRNDQGTLRALKGELRKGGDGY